MGWFDGPSRSSSRSSGHYVRRRQTSPSRKSGIYTSNHSRHSAPSFFGMGGRSSPSVFSSFSSSSRRARPREGFVQRMIRSIKKLFRDIYRYARQHPMKVFMLVVLPLLTSGVLPKLLGMIGIRLPHGVLAALGGSASGARGGGSEGFESKGLSENISSLMNLAKAFA